MTDNLLNGTTAPAPDYMAGVGDTEEFGGGMDGNAYPRLAFKGSRFRLRQGDDEIVLEQTVLEVIILKDYPHISRIFFAEGYDNDEGGGRPACASADGEVPVPTITAPQNTLCATCPQNEKGSSITDDGKKSRACSFYKRLVLVIKGYEDVGPVVADIKAMSLFGDSKSGENWWTLKAYFQRLKANNVLPFHLYTKLTFDTDMSVPKVLFQPVGYVDEKMFVDTITPLVATPDGANLLEQMIDTSTVRIEGDDDDDGQMGLPAGDKPAHLGGPTPPPAEQLPAPAKSVTQDTVAAANAVSADVDLSVSLAGDLAKAVAAGDYGAAAELQAQIKALETEPEEPAPTVQEVVDGLKVDMKKAVDAGDYAGAAVIQEQMVNYIEANKPAPPAAVKAAQKQVDEENLTPAQKGAITRAKNKAKKEAAAAAAAASQTPEPDVTGTDPTAFDDELEGALKDFGF